LNKSEPAARCYAEAVLLLAKERGRVGAVLDDLHAMMEAFHQDRFLWSLFVSPRADRLRKEAVLRKALKGKIAEEVLGLLVILVQKGREALFDNVVDYFERMKDEMENRVHVYVRSAKALDPKVREAVEAQVRQASGKTPVTHEEVDPSLLGGLVVRVNDVLVDGSVRSRLKALRTRMLGDRR
jgi:F-type H+-transporting ATPase subunit delta